ncbi:MAG: WYL domain-containing protein [Firmicutes bacterium]|jgi:predicted DNA-binding transcriptional regulator YafY|nr:WYL domain-containing protein [Bacillota bacterium]MDD4337168.1 WYL domain-containing protein [Bacillota bacterium]MDD4792882.1 WYL domain-containing protein [Bacillota bacterium]
MQDAAARKSLKDEMFRRIIRVINQLLSSSDGMSVAELASACGATPEVVRNDLECLAEYMRAPLLSNWDALDDDADEFGCSSPDEEVWSLASKDFAFPVTSLSTKEARTLLAILKRVECSPGTSEPLGSGDANQSGTSGIVRAVAKLESSVARTESSDAISLAASRRVIKAGRTIYGEGQEESKLDALGLYVSRRQPIRICYVNSAGHRSQRDTCPVALVYDWRTCAWYLYGYNREHGGYRHYRVSRILRHSPSAVSISAPSDEEVEAHVGMCWGVECSSESVEVVVRFLDHFNVIDRMYADTADRPQATYEAQPDGSVIYRDMMPGWNEFRTWVATFGESAEILAPPELRESMAKAVERVLERYGSSNALP